MNHRNARKGLAILLTASLVAPAFAEDIVAESALRDAGFNPYWSTRLPFRRGDTALAAWLVDDTLYIATRLGELHVADAAVGTPVWTRHLTDVGRSLRRPWHFTTAEGRLAVLVTHADGINIFDRASGEQIAEVTGLWPAGSAAVGDALVLYAGSSDGHLYAVRWYDPERRTPIIWWRVVGLGPVTATPVLYGDLLYFSSQSGKVFACTADRNKQLLWDFSTEASLEADISVDDKGVYVAGLDRSLYRVDRETGALAWRFRMPAPLRDAPVVVQGIVYQYCSQTGLAAVEADTGKPVWTLPDGLALASRSGDRTCVLLRGDRVAVVESTTGQLLGTMPFERSAMVPVNRDGIAFYAVAGDGDAACYSPRDVPYLREADLKRRGPASQPATQPAEVPESPPEPPTSDLNLDDPLRSRSDG